MLRHIRLDKDSIYLVELCHTIKANNYFGEIIIDKNLMAL